MEKENKYDDGHKHIWSEGKCLTVCTLCGIGKTVHEERLMKDGLEYRRLKEMINNISRNQKNLDSKFIKIINDNFWELT
jgi:hypothetical protein